MRLINLRLRRQLASADITVGIDNIPGTIVDLVGCRQGNRFESYAKKLAQKHSPPQQQLCCNSKTATNHGQLPNTVAMYVCTFYLRCRDLLIALSHYTRLTSLAGYFCSVTLH